MGLPLGLLQPTPKVQGSSEGPSLSHSSCLPQDEGASEDPQRESARDLQDRALVCCDRTQEQVAPREGARERKEGQSEEAGFGFPMTKVPASPLSLPPTHHLSLFRHMC